MALEEFDGKAEETAKDNQSAPTQQVSSIDPAIQKIIDLQQQQIDSLKQQIQSGSFGAEASAAAIAEAMRPLYERMGDSNIIDKDTRQFRFDNVAVVDDPDDALPLDEQVSFVSYMTYNVITSDKRNGVQVPAPINKIQFIYDSTKRIQNGKDTEMVHMSVYTCRSRKELKWLREHTLFNVDFFDHIKGALADEAKMARKISNIMMTLRTMNVHQLIAMADSNELKNYRGLDIDDLRVTIASQMAEKQKKAEEVNQTRLLNETALEMEFKNNIEH